MPRGKKSPPCTRRIAIRKIVSERRIALQKLADRAGYTKKYVSSILCGESCSPACLAALEKAAELLVKALREAQGDKGGKA